MPLILPLGLQLDDLVSAVLALARGRVGRVAAVRVTVPDTFAPDEVTEGLHARLDAAGLPAVEVATRPASGTAGVLRLLAVEFAR